MWPSSTPSPSRTQRWTRTHRARARRVQSVASGSELVKAVQVQVSSTLEFNLVICISSTEHQTFQAVKPFLDRTLVVLAFERDLEQVVSAQFEFSKVASASSELKHSRQFEALHRGAVSNSSRFIDASASKYCQLRIDAARLGSKE